MDIEKVISETVSPEIVKKSHVGTVIFSIILIFVFLVTFAGLFDTPFASAHPRPCEIKDSAYFKDDSLTKSHYNLLVTTTVYYDGYYMYWKRSSLKDSIHAFNQALLKKRFADYYPLQLYRERIAYEHVHLSKPFEMEGFVIDSVNIFLSIERILLPEVWIYKEY